MKITVNGTERSTRDGATVADLLLELGVNTPLVAVERNRAIVPKSRHAATRIEDGDRFEIVTLVGGG